MLHANALEDAQRLLEDARGVLNVREVLFSDIGSAIATLAGPGVVGIAGCPCDLW